MTIQFIDDNIKKQKRCKTASSGYYVCLSRDLLLIPLEVDTYTNIRGQNNFKKPDVCNRPAYAWFKNRNSQTLIA